MTKIINGKQIADSIANKLKKEVLTLTKKPILAIVIYKPDSRSQMYVKLKQARAKEVGIQVQLLDWSNLSQEDCITNMQQIAQDDNVDGIIVQLPLSGWYDPQLLLDLIPSNKDVDGLSSKSIDDLKDNKQILMPATPKAVITALEYEQINLRNKTIAIIGQGKLVGLPISLILKNRGLNIVSADVNTKNLNSITQKADIVISATGVPNIIKGAMIKDGAVVLDVGIVEVNGKLAGDVDYASVEHKCSVIAKVPGGIGPITVVSLLENVVEAAKKRQGN